MIAVWLKGLTLLLLFLLGNPSSPSRSSDPSGSQARPIQIGLRDIFNFGPAVLISHIYSMLLAFFLCFFVLFQCCSHVLVFGKTIVHEFPISYSHTEWYILFLTVQLQVYTAYSVRHGLCPEAPSHNHLCTNKFS